MKTLLIAFVLIGNIAWAQSTTLDAQLTFFQGRNAVESTLSKSGEDVRFEFSDGQKFDKVYVRILFSKNGQPTVEELTADGQVIHLKSILSEINSGENLTIEIQKLEREGAKFRLAKSKYTFTLQ